MPYAPTKPELTSYNWEDINCQQSAESYIDLVTAYTYFPPTRQSCYAVDGKW
jgi:hypothetical protein